MANWSVAGVNLAGVQPFDNTIVDLPTGPYSVRVSRATLKENTKTGKTNFYINVEVTDGEHKGTDQLIVIGADMTQEGNRRGLKTALISMGHDPASFESGAIEIDESAFVGRDAYIFVKAVPEADKGKKGVFSDRRFITADRYEQIAGSSADEAPASTPAATGSTFQAAAPPAVPQPKNGGLKTTMFARK